MVMHSGVGGGWWQVVLGAVALAPGPSPYSRDGWCVVVGRFEGSLLQWWMMVCVPSGMCSQTDNVLCVYYV